MLAVPGARREADASLALARLKPGPTPSVCVGTTDCRLRRGRKNVKESHFVSSGVLRSRRKEFYMTLKYRRCAGIDVHQKSISVCARIRVGRDQFQTESAVFRTFTRDLEKMAAWLRERRQARRHMTRQSERAARRAVTAARPSIWQLANSSDCEASPSERATEIGGGCRPGRPTRRNHSG